MDYIAGMKIFKTVCNVREKAQSISVGVQADVLGQLSARYPNGYALKRNDCHTQEGDNVFVV